MGKAVKVRVLSGRESGHDVVVVPCFRGRAPETAGLPPVLARAVQEAASRGGFTGRRGQRTEVRAKGKNASVVTVRGLGKIKALTRAKLRQFLVTAVRETSKNGFKKPLISLPEHALASGEDHAESVLRALASSAYSFDEFRSKPSDKVVRAVGLAVPKKEVSVFKSMNARATATAEGAMLTQDLANTPPNEAYPESMAARAREIGKKHGMKVRVLGMKQLEKEGMGGILAVGRGSRRPPRLVVLEWGEGKKRVSLVGKGVTFDTGGISLKPPASMDDMKYDKAGACTVMGIAAAAASLDLGCRFRAYLPFAENMPDGEAYRPGDIVRCYNGKTVEILNTDAEGRMLLADALALADKDGADVILDFATLTGACVVALGLQGAGLFTHNDKLAGELLAAGVGADEKLWRLPLWPEFGEAMEGRHADLKNSGGRWGGASTAAAFLSRFVESKSWAHLDIAGPAFVGSKQKGPYGATGYGVALTINWLYRGLG